MSEAITDKKASKRKGPSKEQALKNLAKAHAVQRKNSTKTQTSVADVSDDVSTDMSDDLSSYMAASEETRRRVDKETSQAIMFHLGDKLSRLVKQSSKDKLLEKSYGVKSLSDMYQSYIKQAYPSGLDAHDSSHLSHLLGSVMSELKSALHVNIHVTPHVTPTPPRVEQSSGSPIIDVTHEVRSQG